MTKSQPAHRRPEQKIFLRPVLMFLGYFARKSKVPSITVWKLLEAISKAPETNNDSSELYEGEIVFVVDVVSGFNTAEVLKPGEEALY
ncbi:MAG: hypothetical protein ACK5GN_13360, partial [Pseudomonadota bacterium]